MIETLFILKKGNARVEVIRDNGLICFAGSRGKEWIIPGDLESFTKFYINNGYSKQLVNTEA